MEDYILGVVSGFLEILSVEGSADTCPGEVNLCQKGLGGIVVYAVVPSSGLLRELAKSGLESVDDVFIDILLALLEDTVVVRVEKFGVVVNDRNFAE